MKIVLGNELARQRVEAGLKQDDAAEVLRCTQQKIAHIESGSGIRPVELDALLERYGATEADKAYARDLQAESNRRTKRGAFSTRFRQHMRLLVDMEPSCQRIFSYRAMNIPGLLQTEQYMRTLFRAWRPSPSQEQIDQDTADRLARQRVLDNTDQQFWFIIDEAALRRWSAGSTEVMKEQVMRLVEAVDRPNIDLQLVPFNVGYYMGQGHDYSIFEYDTKTPVSIVYLEQHDGGTYVDDSKRTAQYLTLWDQQKAAASGPEQTRRILLDLADTL
ncbi:Scr1 family TA system antitoxin-like transcriptional regulator [Saccharopolyspora hordei]|uniref:Transcriptional regulator with XRE-family HTH domain n=2 Tax=Saccharopolyspora hordei TaxID=1838 RepID=A0A853AUS8_9PSEU|nr:transcriptional regulator with XRE-family HTH domain [Saccharopolyspora hordei]